MVDDFKVHCNNCDNYYWYKDSDILPDNIFFERYGSWIHADENVIICNVCQESLDIYCDTDSLIKAKQS